MWLLRFPVSPTAQTVCASECRWVISMRETVVIRRVWVSLVCCFDVMRCVRVTAGAGWLTALSVASPVPGSPSVSLPLSQTPFPVPPLLCPLLLLLLLCLLPCHDGLYIFCGQSLCQWASLCGRRSLWASQCGRLIVGVSPCGCLNVGVSLCGRPPL